MQFHLIPMTAEYAREIVTWKYSEQYAFYDYEKEAEHILDAAKWGRSLFAVLDEAGRLCGELTLWFQNSAEERVPITDMEAEKLEGCDLWIGFGMRPDLTGRGLGLAFVNECTSFAAAFSRKQYQFTGDSIVLGVYQFNQRAIKVYERAGFVKFTECKRTKNGIEYQTQRMRKRIEN